MGVIIRNGIEYSGAGGMGGGGCDCGEIIYLTQEEYDALPASKEEDNIEYRITNASESINAARDWAYDNAASGLEADNVQDAIDEVNSKIGGFEFYTDEQGKAYYKPMGADSGIPFFNMDLSNAEFAYVHFIKGATYMSSVQVNNGTTRNDSTIRSVDMTKMKADLCYFKYGEEYDGITCSYMSSGFTVKQDGKFYVYSTCPNYERNEIIDCKAGDIIAMLIPITTSDTTINHINLVVAL